MKSLLLITFVVLTLTVSAQKQGIIGKVFWLSGNLMPGPQSNISPEQGVAREICVYKVTKLQDVDQNNSFFSNLKTELVTTTLSDRDGSFKIKLPPGEYSVFVKEQQGLFANSFNKDNEINAIVVKPKEFSWVTINIDYDAAY